MSYLIFYSWQSDRPDECNRKFIREAIDAAVAPGAAVEESPRVEAGMENEPGSPEVAAVMFRRIRRSAVVVCDTTLVGSIPQPSGGAKRTPNPNVLLEMGYAAALLGWERVICVMNEAFGERTDQPFDVRNRRFPIDYRLAPGDTGRRAGELRKLTRWIRHAIETVATFDLETANDAAASLDVHALNLMAAFGKFDGFRSPDPNATTFGGPLDTAKFTAGVGRLLDLKLIRADVNPAAGLYAYHWTYLGRMSLIKLGIRSPDLPPPRPPDLD